MLHLPNNLPERREIATQNTAAIHELKGTTDALRLLEDLNKERSINRVGAPLAIHLSASVI